MEESGNQEQVNRFDSRNGESLARKHENEVKQLVEDARNRWLYCREVISKGEYENKNVIDRLEKEAFKDYRDIVVVFLTYRE